MPNLYPIGSVQDGPQLTVSDILKDPAVVPLRILDMLDQMFVVDQLLRSGPMADSGAVKFHQSNPLFAQVPSSVVGEFGEIPVGINDIGQLFITQTAKRALGVRISVEMERRNNIDAVNLQITQVRNTMVRDWDGVFMAALILAAQNNGQVIAAGTTWDQASASTRADVAAAKLAVRMAQLPGTTNEFLGFTADTLVVHPAAKAAMESNDETWKAWVGNTANLSPAVTGLIGSKLWGLDVWETWNIPETVALVLQRKVVGFISDERPLQATPTRWVPDSEHWRSDAIRQSAIGIDQPLAVAEITGVLA